MPHLYERGHTRIAGPNATHVKRPGASIMEAFLGNVSLLGSELFWCQICMSGSTFEGLDPNATHVKRTGASMMEALWKTYHCSGRCCSWCQICMSASALEGLERTQAMSVRKGLRSPRRSENAIFLRTDLFWCHICMSGATPEGLDRTQAIVSPKRASVSQAL